MELKSGYRRRNRRKASRSNRTFMELKFVRLLQTSVEHTVLIVPLWN